MAAGGMRDRGLGAAGLAIALLLHALALWGLWNLRVIPTPTDAITLLVNFIVPPAPKVADTPKAVPVKPRQVEKTPLSRRQLS